MCLHNLHEPIFHNRGNKKCYFANFFTHKTLQTVTACFFVVLNPVFPTWLFTLWFSFHLCVCGFWFGFTLYSCLWHALCFYAHVQHHSHFVRLRHTVARESLPTVHFPLEKEYHIAIYMFCQYGGPYLKHMAYMECNIGGRYIKCSENSRLSLLEGFTAYVSVH